jgi:hypothetical protein
MEGSYPNKLVINTPVHPWADANLGVQYENLNGAAGTCNIGGECSIADKLTIPSCESAGGTWTVYDTQQLCEAGGGTWQPFTEEVDIESIEFDTTYNLWKINLQEPIKTEHSRGDVIYIKESAGTEGYAYLVADHPVESITNIKIDGMPTSGSVILDSSTSSHSAINYWKLPYGKAYVIVPTQAGMQAKSGSGALTIEDTIDVNDTIDVDDQISVDEPSIGHAHITSASGYFDHTIEWAFKSYVIGTGWLKIEILSGNFSYVIFYDSGKVAIPNIKIYPPLSFTSDSESVSMFYSSGTYYSAFSSSAGFYYLSLNGTKLDQYGTSSNASASVGTDSVGSLVLKYPAVEPAPYEKAAVTKTGAATKAGSADKIGTVTLKAGNSAADILVGTKVTCDVIGMCDGSLGYIRPHNQISKFITTFARNQGNMTVNYVDETGMNTVFDKVYNALDSAVAATNYPVINQRITFAQDNPSPNAVLNPTVPLTGYQMPNIEGFHCIDFVITEPNRFRDIVGDMLYHSNCIINWRNGDAYIKHYNDVLIEDDYIDSSDLLMRSMSLSRSKSVDLATEVSVRYDYSQKQDYARRYQYEESTGLGFSHAVIPSGQQQALGSLSKERNYDLPMIRDQVAAEFVSKRLFDDYSTSKFEVSVSSVLKNMAIEAGDVISVDIPIYNNGVLNKGLVTRRTIEFGSAIDKQADLIHLTVKENHTGDGFYLKGDLLTDSTTISDGVPVVTLNDANTQFKTLSDTVGISEVVDVQPVQQFTDACGITESVALTVSVSVSDSLTIDDNYLRFTGILFWTTEPTDTITTTDSATAVAVDSVYVPDVYVGTDLVNIGVFE